MIVDGAINISFPYRPRDYFTSDRCYENTQILLLSVYAAVQPTAAVFLAGESPAPAIDQSAG